MSFCLAWHRNNALEKSYFVVYSKLDWVATKKHVDNNVRFRGDTKLFTMCMSVIGTSGHYRSLARRLHSNTCCNSFSDFGCWLERTMGQCEREHQICFQHLFFFYVEATEVPQCRFFITLTVLVVVESDVRTYLLDCRNHCLILCSCSFSHWRKMYILHMQCLLGVHNPWLKTAISSTKQRLLLLQLVDMLKHGVLICPFEVALYGSYVCAAKSLSSFCFQFLPLSVKGAFCGT